jgi:phosphatidylglycerol lysyltransferase
MRHGWNATSYQLVNPGLKLWFSREGDAVIGYVRRKRVRVIAGTPVCGQQRLNEVIAEWEADCDAAGDGICYFGAAGRIESLLRSDPRYSFVVLGAQPIWSPGSWKKAISSDKAIRAQLNRARNKEVVVEEWSAEQATANPELHKCLVEWLATRGLPPLHFLVEPETLDFIGDRRIFVATRQGKPIGFTVLSPIPTRNGWLTEQFPRGFGAPNGTVELLMDSAVNAVGRDGAQYVTMGLVPLSKRVSAVPETPAWVSFILGWVRAHGRRFYNFDGLEWFKAKFHPDEWEPIYAVSKEPKVSFRTLYAVAAAFSDGPPLLAVSRGMLKALRQELSWLIKKQRKDSNQT